MRRLQMDWERVVMRSPAGSTEDLLEDVTQTVGVELLSISAREVDAISFPGYRVTVYTLVGGGWKIVGSY